MLCGVFRGHLDRFCLICPQKSSLALFALEEELELAGAESYISNRGIDLLYFPSEAPQLLSPYCGLIP